MIRILTLKFLTLGLFCSLCIGSITQLSDGATTRVATGAAPVVFWASDPVQPNETVVASTGNTNSNSQVTITQLANTSAGSPLFSPRGLTFSASASVLNASATVVDFVIPSNFKAGCYAYQVSNGATTSLTKFLNIPEIMNVQGDSGSWATKGGWIEIHGQNLGSSRKPQLALVTGSTVYYLSPVPGDKNQTHYRQRFKVPASGVPNGTYSVYEHNGLGGPLGWSKFSGFTQATVNTFTIANVTTYPTGTVVNVAPPTGSGDDSKITTALSKASSEGGAMVQFASGTYGVSSKFTVPANTYLVGAGNLATTIKYTANPIGGAGANKGLIVSSSAYPGTAAPWGVSNLVVTTPNDFDGIILYNAFNTAPMYIKNCALTIPEMSSPSGNACAVYSRGSINETITGNTITAPYCLNFIAPADTYALIEGNTLNWTWADVDIQAMCSNFIIDSNISSVRGNTITNSWPPSMGNEGTVLRTTNANPRNGTFSYLRDIYFGHNIRTSQNGLGNSGSLLGAHPGDFGIGMTFDATDACYLGPVASVNGTTVTLDHAVSNYNNSAFNFQGGVFKVESGTGMGQWAMVTSLLPNATALTIDRTLPVPLDSTSVVNICSYVGGIVWDSNTYGADLERQTYFCSMDAICANNRYTSGLPIGSQDGAFNPSTGGGEWWQCGRHYKGQFTQWHYQFLNNNFSTCDQRVLMSGQTPVAGYTGPNSAFGIVRDNSQSGVATVTVMLDSKNYPVWNSLVEGNSVGWVSLGPSGHTAKFSGTVLRHNGSASYECGNTPSGPAAVVGIIYEP